MSANKRLSSKNELSGAKLVALRAISGVSAVIVANNEGGTVGDVVSQCKSYCDQVLVVDDGSTDNTAEVSEAAGAKIVRNAIRLGVVKSIEKGLRSASGEIIVTLDGDGQHDPLEIENLVRIIESGEADLVLGARRGGVPLSERFIRRLVSSRVKCGDVGTGYRALTAQLAKRMDFWGFCLCGSFVVEANKLGARIVEVPIHVGPRRSGKSHWDGRFSRGWVHLKQVFVLLPQLIFH